MGLPEILIEFKTQGTTAVKRSQRGIVALILKDDTDATFDTKIYTGIDEVDPTDWTAANKDFIDKTFLGVPSKIIVERIATADLNYNNGLNRLKNKKFNYLAIPGIASGDVANIATWIKTERDTNNKTFKTVLPNHTGDHEGIINFTTEDISVSGTTYSASDYTCRIAGILAGLPFSRSATYYELTEVESITESTDPGTDVDAGKLLLINDGEKIKIARGVNSLTTTTATKGEDFKKIKIVEGVDLVRDDIRNTFDNNYIGKVVNTYDNKVLFLAAVNAYFGELERQDILDPSFENLAEVDMTAQKLYLQGQGVDLDSLKDQEIKEYNTGSKVYAMSSVKFIDAMEDMQFTVFM